MLDEKSLKEARSLLEGSRRVRALTGAGVSAESGVPTFRGHDGLWKKFRPEELATPEAFARDPKLVWEWYDWRRGLIAKTRPNPGHRALVELEKSVRDFWLITQNVDGLHQLAGSERILPLHGNIWELRCLGCGKSGEDRRAPLPELPPECGECGAMLRPGVVWFGEGLPQETLSKSIEVSGDAELFLAIGTAGAVEPAASMARIAREAGAQVIEINPEESSLSSVADVVLRGKSGEVLPRLLG